MRNKNEAFVSYSDDLALASRLNLSTERLNNAMNENVNQISIEFFKNEVNATNKKAYLIVHIWSFKSLINATNLLAVRECRRTRLFNLLDRVEIHDIHYRVYEMQEIYINYVDDLRLCNALKFLKIELNQIKNAIKKSWLDLLIYMQHESKINFEKVRWKMTVEKMTDENINVKTHVQVEEFLLSSAKLSSFACFINDVTTNSRRKKIDNDLNDRYYKELNFEDEEIEFYKYAESFIKTSQVCFNNNVNIISNEIESQQSRDHDQQQTVENSNQKNDKIDNVFCDNEFDLDEFERNRANTHNKIIKKIRKHFNEVHRAILETAYCHNLTLHRTAQAEIAKELELEKYRVYICSFNETYFHMLTTAIQ